MTQNLDNKKNRSNFYIFNIPKKMEFKKKDIRAKDPLQFGYCDIYYILQYFDRIGYTAGIYWWNEDIYYIDGVYITTGYRPTGRRPKNEEKRYKLNEKIKERGHEQPREKRKEKAKKLVLKLIENA